MRQRQSSNDSTSCTFIPSNSSTSVLHAAGGARRYPCLHRCSKKWGLLVQSKCGCNGPLREHHSKQMVMASTAPIASTHSEALDQSVSCRLFCHHAIRTTRMRRWCDHAMQNAYFDKSFLHNVIIWELSMSGSTVVKRLRTFFFASIDHYFWEAVHLWF